MLGPRPWHVEIPWTAFSIRLPDTHPPVLRGHLRNGFQHPIVTDFSVQRRISHGHSTCVVDPGVHVLVVSMRPHKHGHQQPPPHLMHRMPAPTVAILGPSPRLRCALIGEAWSGWLPLRPLQRHCAEANVQSHPVWILSSAARSQGKFVLTSLDIHDVLLVPGGSIKGPDLEPQV